MTKLHTMIRKGTDKCLAKEYIDAKLSALLHGKCGAFVL